MSNAIDFISAYNVIDSRMRAMYRGKGSLQFTDLVRRCAESNATVKRYQEELLSCARLRNAIVHESTKERIIAEPCDDMTKLIVHIAELLSAPPKLGQLKEKGATGIAAESSVKEAIGKVAQSNYSNLPVYRNGRMVGMLNNRRLVRVLGAAIERGEDIDETLKKPCASVLAEEDLIRFYKVMGKENTIQEAIDAFAANRKLLAVIVTEGGAIGDKIVNILTSADLPKLMKLLQN